ncbi:MAG: two-component sensor histidine kinase [Rhodospirillaceae bacterium]|nr:two-component sensor histidine kinase [Rhodospirillaceae bacterium]
MGVALWGVSRATAPLPVFAAAAERLGVDVNAEPLSEKGPPEVRRATRAFNTMQMRVKRYIQDRTQMLAAISHDLRTPITRLRLRAEFVDDDQQREKMMHDLNEMEAMIAETLVFARDDAANEPASHIDAAAVVASLCSDLSFSGREVAYTGPDSFEFLTRPLAFKRAITNLVDNALKYGKTAQVTLAPAAGELRIYIDDTGPGVPPHEMDRVFQPFVRLEGSRSRETGGAGLGLTIARNAIRSMGGDVDLMNRTEGGLRVTVSLPVAGAETEGTA